MNENPRTLPDGRRWNGLAYLHDSPVAGCQCVTCAPPPIAGAADLEYSTRIDADRVTAEFRVKRTPVKPQHSIDDLPLFGGERQGGLFEP